MFLFMGGATGGGPQAEIEFLTSVVGGASQTKTFSTVDFGAAVTDRVIAVSAYGRRNAASAGTVSSMTCGGVSATKITSQTGTPAGHELELWYAVVPTGTTGDIVIAWSGGMAENSMGCWRITAAVTAPHDSGQDDGNPMTEPLTIPAGGVAVAAVGNNSSSTHTFTELTEDWDTIIRSDDVHAGAHGGPFSALQTDLSIQCDGDPGGSGDRMCVASWGPAT